MHICFSTYQNQPQVVTYLVCTCVAISLETFFLSRDIMLFTAEDIARLEGQLNRLKLMVEEDSAEADLITLHTDFHCTLYKKSDNQLLIKLIKIFATVQRSLTLLNHYRSTNRPLPRKR